MQKNDDEQDEDRISIHKGSSINQENDIINDEKQKKNENLRSSIKKKEQINISHQKVCFQVEQVGASKENIENEKNNDTIEEVKVVHNNLAPHIENKIRNSIRLLENDIKSLEVIHVRFFFIFGTVF